jgi:tetratricopeptide (TPR) repeat protein
MPDLVERTTQLHQRALAQCERSRFDLADRTLLKALGDLNRSDLTDQRSALAAKVRVLTTLSTVEIELRGQDGGAALASTMLTEAHQLAENLAEGGLEFTVDNALALQALRRGDPEEALERFAAAELHVAEASSNDALTFYLNRGYLRMQRLELPAARRDFDKCIALTSTLSSDATDGKLKSSQFMARHNLGYVEYLAGNLPLALEIMDEAAVIPAGASLAIASMDKAQVLIEAGLSDAADAALREAEKEFRRGRLGQELAETELARAECAILSGNLKAARRLAGSARTRSARRGNDRWRRVAELTLLSADLADGRPPTRLIAPAQRLAAEFADQSLDVQSRTAALIACAALCAAGRAQEAQQLLDRLGPIRRMDPIASKLQHRTVAATLLQHSGYATRARRQVQLGLSVLGRHQAQFGSIDLQTAGAIHGRELVRLDLEMALSDGRPRVVFDAIERGRAISSRLTAVTSPAGESAELLAELRQLSETLKQIGDDPAAAAEAHVMRQRASALYSELSAISWRAIGDGDVVHPALMSTVAAAAGQQNKRLVSFCPGRDHWSAVVLGGGRPRLVQLPGGGLDAAASRRTLSERIVELARRCQADLNVLAYDSIPSEMRQAASASLKHSLAELDEILIAPLNLGDHGVVIIPTGPTATLPWNCLPSLRGRSVEVSPTATSWLTGVLSIDNDGLIAVEAFSGPGLDSAADEAEQVAQLWAPVADRVTANRGDAATRDRLAEALASATLVHVAAHGSHMRQNPLFSSLELIDGPLFAYEIADRRVAPHVVLSACELGMATTRPGDENLGLTQVLLQLGAQCVVAGVAQVHDDLAGHVMADYHRRMANGAESASALAAATESGPYVPFICFGSSWGAYSG